MPKPKLPRRRTRCGSRPSTERRRRSESAGGRSGPGDLDVRRVRAVVRDPQRTSPGRRLPRPSTSASARSPTTSRPPSQSTRKPSDCWPSTRPSWPQRPAKFGSCWKKPAATPSTQQDSIEAEGRKAAKDELDRALREIERAKDGAIQDLAVASANVAIDLAGKVIRDKLTAERAESDRPRRARQAGRRDAEQELSRLANVDESATIMPPNAKSRSTKP